MEKLIKEYKWYLKNKKNLLRKYLNKYIIIKDNIIIGAYDDYNASRFEALEKYAIGDFLIQQVLVQEPIVVVSNIY